MPLSVAPLTARSHALISGLILTLAIMGLSPLAEIVAVRWPPHLGEAYWRYQTLMMFLSNAPQITILVGIIAAIGVFAGSRAVIRGTAVALALIAISELALVMLFALDFLQVRRLVGQDAKRGFTMLAIKTIAFSIVLALAAAWTAYQAWLASAKEDEALHRQKGHGLVVGQAE